MSTVWAAVTSDPYGGESLLSSTPIDAGVEAAARLVAAERRPAPAADASQATDPRKREAKRPRLAPPCGVATDPRLAATRSAASTAPAPAHSLAGSPGAENAAADGDALSARIFATLHRLAPGSLKAAEPALGSRLQDALRHLLPASDSAAALQSSQAGQELFRVMQHMAPQPAANPVVQQPVAQAPVRQRTTRRLPPKQIPEPEDEKSDEDDGVPHRLPPGFGAIPEDIVEARAREREEQRVRAIKSTQPCRFGTMCKRRDCPNMHQEGRTIDTVLNLCSFGQRCKRMNCFYDHPEGREIDSDTAKSMCKFMERCRRPDCLYTHPPGRDAVMGADLRTCYFCHANGHIAQDCPQNPESFAHISARQAANKGLAAITAPV